MKLKPLTKTENKEWKRGFPRYAFFLHRWWPFQCATLYKYFFHDFSTLRKLWWEYILYKRKFINRINKKLSINGNHRITSISRNMLRYDRFPFKNTFIYFLATLDFPLPTNVFFFIIKTIYCLLPSILLAIFNDHVNIMNLLSTMNQSFFLDKCGKSTLLKKGLGCLRLCHCLHCRN